MERLRAVPFADHHECIALRAEAADEIERLERERDDCCKAEAHNANRAIAAEAKNALTAVPVEKTE